MSENIPESIPTSADPRSHRPTKKRALTPVSKQAAQVDALFAKPPSDASLDFSSKSSGPPARTLAAPPEIVTNVQGSSAGAGSGEFHVYKASRRREYERVRAMEEDARREVEEREFKEKVGEMKRRDEERTSKNQKRRAKQRERNARKKGGAGGAGDGEEKGGGEVKVKGLGPKKVVGAGKEDEDEEGEGGEVRAVAAEEDGGITIQDDD